MYKWSYKINSFNYEFKHEIVYIIILSYIYYVTIIASHNKTKVELDLCDMISFFNIWKLIYSQIDLLDVLIILRH